MQARAVATLLLVLAVLGANAASQESGDDPIDAISGTLADRDSDRFTRRGVVLDEHFREVACEPEAPPEPPADAAQRPADPVAAASSGPSEWIAVGALSLLGAVLVLLLARRTRRRA